MTVNTIYGAMEESQLTKREGTEDDSEKTLSWIEFWLKDEMVHRSVNLVLKEGLNLMAEPTSLN